MKTKELLSMVDFILEIDFMTTIEFCKNYEVQLPTIQAGANGLLQIDAIKHKMFVEYAKFLNKKLTIDMFEGEKNLFVGGKYVDRQPSIHWNTYEIRNRVVFQDSNGKQNNSIGLKVSDLCGFGVLYTCH
jgi:hypothetical protein